PISPQQADVVLTKAVDDAAPNVGGTITYTIGLEDLGPGDATNVVVTDVLPVGLTIVSATSSQGTYSPATGVWIAGTVAVGTPQPLLIRASVTSPAQQANTATISHADQFDPDPGNNTASVVETPQQADLALAKTVSNTSPNVGDTITYTVTLTDTGPDAA